MTTDPCIFCDIANKKRNDYVIWENEKMMLILEIFPAKKAHCMLIPKQHVTDVFETNLQLYHELFSYARRMSHVLKKYTNAKRVGLAIVGMSVAHAHIHLVPLHASNELFDPAKFKKATAESLHKTHEDLHKVFAAF